jgi:hypothetical protein
MIYFTSFTLSTLANGYWFLPPHHPPSVPYIYRSSEGKLRLPLACSLLRWLFYNPEDGGDTFLRNVGYHSTHYTASYPRRRYSSKPFSALKEKIKLSLCLIS